MPFLLTVKISVAETDVPPPEIGETEKGRVGPKGESQGWDE
ncbi:Uncharacterised protein [Kluyvera cryocrescens]|uniref:Uncharacterized protein n=1 Tax=Kluyvera cryocrescens TaxID=580 RepID=A0A485BMU7_KLUCR|nr:Uncharacterised protein [Kluyvera cryocrescens]